MIVDADGFGPDDILELCDVSRETIERLITIVDLLDVWRNKTNLIGPSEMDAIWRRHVYDSLLLVPHIPSDAAVLDLGSGAGFPGLILSATASETMPPVYMVESVGKKCAFLRAAIERAGLTARVANLRAEAAHHLPGTCISARAFAALPRIFEYAEPWFQRGAVGVFPKGRRWEEELTRATECWKFAYDVIPSQSGDGVILKVSEVSRGG